MTGMKMEKSVRPEKFRLSRIYPNPFNPVTKIEYFLANSGGVVLEIYDILGKMITRLVNEYQTAGKFTIDFKAIDLPSGIYIIRLQQGSQSDASKMVLIK